MSINSLANRGDIHIRAISMSFPSIAAFRSQNVQFVSAPMAPRPRRSHRNFDMAGNDRLMGDWFSSSTTRNDKIRTSLRTMRNRSRELAENDEHAINYLEMCRNNIVGAEGILLKMMVRDDNGSLDQRANDLILEAWQEWCKPENCTVTRGMSWWEVQRVLATEEPQAGETFVRMVQDFKNPFGFALQLIEADCVDEELNMRLDSGNKIRMGVETNPWGERVAYWIRAENPYDTLSTNIKHERILASEMLHKFIPLGLKDLRGIPWFHAPGRSMRMLHEYDFSAMVAARMGADNRGFFEKVPDTNGEYKGDGEDEEGNTVASLGPGQMEQLPEGIRFNQVESDYPHAQYGPFTKVHQRRIATGLRGANYNQLTGDYESVNYSSLRAAFLDSRDVWKSLQADRIIKIDKPIFKAWLKQALLYRAIALPADKLKKFNAPKFMGRGWGWVDPTAEVAAAKESVAQGFTSRSAVVSSNGGDFDHVCAEQENDRELATSYALNFETERDVQQANLLGILGRGGFVTPSRADELVVRERFGMAPVSDEVDAAWDKSDGVRLPITLQTPDNFEMGNNGAASATTNPPKKS